MKDRKLAVRYARALLSVLSDPATAESTDRFLIILRDALTESPEFRRLMLDPAYSAMVKVKALRTMVSRQGLPDTVGNFLEILVLNGRASSLPSIAELFHSEREAALGIVPAKITTAVPLGDELTLRAGRAVEKLTGRKVRLTCSVDAALLGGVVTRVGSSVYDGSLRTQLDDLRNRMAQE